MLCFISITVTNFEIETLPEVRGNWKKLHNAEL